ncbi:hypothetical protein DRQ11_08000 [candidate division KSB1 bacterium]|nr:MAG: hypothetical protein DRQ11_08000 [candidate division KSB1 bacterium]
MRSEESVKRFFREHSKAFDRADKRAAFLVGVLTKRLLDKQLATRNSAPFRSKLYGLKLDEGRLRKIFSEAIEKLAEYNVSYLELQSLTSKVLIEAENEGWNLSKDELSYYFALGLNLGGIFK